MCCLKCPRLAVFKELCDVHSNDPYIDEEDYSGPHVVIDESSGEPNYENTKSTVHLFIHGRQGEKDISVKPVPRNTYNNWSTRAQHSLIANLPPSSDLFIRTAKNARYPLVNAPTVAVPKHPRLASGNPPFSRTLALGQPPNRQIKYDNNGHLRPAVSLSSNEIIRFTVPSSSTQGRPRMPITGIRTLQPPTYRIISNNYSDTRIRVINTNKTVIVGQ